MSKVKKQDGKCKKQNADNKKSRNEAEERSVKVENPPIPIGVFDSVVEIADEAMQLHQALECANTAMQTEFDDPMDYMEGMIAVLLSASDALAAKSSAFKYELCDMMDQECD